MNIKNVAFIVFLLFIQCSNNDNKRSNGLEEMAEKNGYKFYNEFELLSLRGKKELTNLSEIKEYPVYAIQNSDENKITVATIYKDVTFWQVFYKSKDAFLSTKYYKDEELNSFYAREINIVRKSKYLCFEYICEDNFEYLNKILIEFTGGKKISYQNTEKTNLNFVMDIDTNSINAIYPTFEKTIE